MSDESEALSDELFGLVEYDQGKAFISDETASLSPSEVLDSAERSLAYTRRVERLLGRFLATHGRPPGKREVEIPRAKRRKETQKRKPRSNQRPWFIENNRERMPVIVAFYYGTNDNQPRTLEWIGEQFGVTRERIRQLLTKAHLFYNDEQMESFRAHRITCRGPLKPTTVKPGTVIRRAITSETFDPTRAWLTAQKIEMPDCVADDPISVLAWIHGACRISTFPGYRWCANCHRIKAVSEFGKNVRCKPCNAARTREWNKRLPEKARAMRRQSVSTCRH